MPSNRTAVVVAIFLKIMAVLGGVVLVLRWFVVAGWIAFIGFALTGLAYLVGTPRGERRRTSIAFGVYMLVVAIYIGTSLGDMGMPRVIRLLLLAVLIVSNVWFMRVARQESAADRRTA